MAAGATRYAASISIGTTDANKSREPKCFVGFSIDDGFEPEQRIIQADENGESESGSQCLRLVPSI